MFPLMIKVILMCFVMQIRPVQAEQEMVVCMEEKLLPTNHPAYEVLCRLCQNRSIFDNFESLSDAGFMIRNMPITVREWTIMVAEHPEVKGFLIKKYPNHFPKDLQLYNYLTRINGADQIDAYIKTHQFQHLTVPKKWLFCLPPKNDESEDYLLVVDDIPILPGGYWGEEVFDLYSTMSSEVMRELCCLLHDLKGCDAWPQNQPFTKEGKIAFIDTEALGKSFGDFIYRLIPFINPALHLEAYELWNFLENQSLSLSNI